MEKITFKDGTVINAEKNETWVLALLSFVSTPIMDDSTTSTP